MFTRMLPFPFRNHASLIRKTCSLSEVYFSSGPSSSHAVETVQKVDETLSPSAESKTEDRLNKWRIDEKNKFLEIPQAWVSSFDSIEENRLDLIDLHPDVFRTFPRLDILHRNITWQDKYRQMIYIKMLTRAEMPGGHKKPWPQKGLGKARHGSRRSPIWLGGGIAHGIRGPKTFFYMLPDSLRISGLCIALTIKHAQDDLVIVDDLNSLQVDNPEYLENMAAERNWGYSVLFVHENDVAPRNLALALEDLPYFNVMPYYGLNCLSMLKHDTLVISKNALAIVEKRLLEQMHRADSLRTKFRYIDHKRKLMSEGEHEEDDEMPPFI